MSYEQFVRYKQQLRDTTKGFLRVANTLTEDQLEIVLARFADRVVDDKESALQDEYKGLLVSVLIELREVQEVKRIHGYLESQTSMVNWTEYWKRHRDWRIREGFWTIKFGKQKTHKPNPTDCIPADLLIDQVADYPIVPKEQRPADKTPEEYTPTREEIKRLAFQNNG